MTKNFRNFEGYLSQVVNIFRDDNKTIEYKRFVEECLKLTNEQRRGLQLAEMGCL
jgi:hypothetical protein